MALIAALVVAGHSTAAQETAVDLELVLAVDASSSVNFTEFALQMDGYAKAFRAPGVISAIESGAHGAIAVALVQWASPGQLKVAIEWTKIRSAEDAEALAERVALTPRYIPGGGTGIGSAIGFAAGLFEGNGYAGARRVIDISGDGSETHAALPLASRDAAIEAGITINGLPILNEEPALDQYYRESVIGGRDAFAVVAADYGAFAAALQTKLIREIGGEPALSRGPADDPAPAVQAARISAPAS